MRRQIITLLNKIWRLIRRLFWLGLWAVGVSLLLCYLLRWWPGDQFAPVRLFNYFTPWLLIFLIPGAAIALMAHRYKLAMLLTLPALLIGITYAPLFLPRSSTSQVLAADKPLKVMSHNIWEHNQHHDEMVNLVKEEQPDILLLQEAYWSKGYTVKHALANIYPNQKSYFSYNPNLGQLIVSRYPITPLETSFAKGRAQKVWVNTPHGPIEVWNVHFLAPSSWTTQHQQVTALEEDIAAATGPLIVGGDFNSTDQAETYQTVAQHLSNAHWEAGQGFGFSYPGNTPHLRPFPALFPLVRIDHIFYNDHFLARSAKTLSSSAGSDHRPIVAELLRTN